MYDILGLGSASHKTTTGPRYFRLLSASCWVEVSDTFRYVGEVGLSESCG